MRNLPPIGGRDERRYAAVLTTVPRVPLVLGTVLVEVVAAAVVAGAVVVCDKGDETGAVSGDWITPAGAMIDISISQLKKVLDSGAV